MAQSKLCRMYKMLIVLSTQHDNRQTYMIHVLEDYNTDENDKNDIFIPKWIFVQMIRKEIVKQMIHQEDASLKPINRKDIIIIIIMHCSNCDC